MRKDSFDRLVVARQLTVMPHQPQVGLVITAQAPTGPVSLFEINKQDYSDNSELEGRAINIVCRIDLEPGLSLGKSWGTVIEVK